MKVNIIYVPFINGRKTYITKLRFKCEPESINIFKAQQPILRKDVHHHSLNIAINCNFSCNMSTSIQKVCLNFKKVNFITIYRFLEQAI